MKIVNEDCNLGDKINRWTDLLFIALIFIIIFFVNIPLSNLELISPDASGYLDMGRNLFSKKGAVISYNLYQFYPGRYYPFLPYMQFGYAIVAGLIWSLFNLKAVIGFNILLLAVNCILIYKILLIVTAHYTSSFLIALFMGLSRNLVYSSIFPWTEHLHLFLLLLVIFIFLRYDKDYLLQGALLAVSCFIRISGLYNVLAFGIALVVLKGFSKKTLKIYIKLASGFITVFLLYEIFCYIKYGVFYPQYLSASVTYRASEIYPGAFYKKELPILNMPPLKQFAKAVFPKFFFLHILNFINTFGFMKFLFILTPLYAINDSLRRKPTPAVVILFFQGLFVIIGYSLSLWWLPEIETFRHSLIPFIGFGLIAFLSMKEIFEKILKIKLKVRFPILFVITISVFLYVEIKSYLPFRNYWINIYPQQYYTYKRFRDEIYDWVKNNTEKDTLIASNFLQDSFLLQRPFVSLPSGNALTAKNMVDYLNIYKPEYIITDNERLVSFLKQIGFIERKRNNMLVLLQHQKVESE